MDFDQPITGVMEESSALKLSRNYKLISKIGEGGMGEVFLGQTSVVGENVEVAIKVFNKADPPTHDALDRFRREARLLRRARHPNIVSYVDYWENEKTAYLVMDFIDGQDMEDYVRKAGGFLSPGKLIGIIIDVMDALCSMYREYGMVHRDLKPANIIIREKTGLDEKTYLNAVLIDFGNSKVIENEQNTSLTMVSGIMTGTPGYTAPGVSIDIFDERDDVFSMAGTMMFGLLGENQLEVPGDMNASMIRIMKQEYNLGNFENTAIGHWIRINLNSDRYKRMTLHEARNCLLRIKKDPLAHVSERFIRVIGSDDALYELTEIADNAGDVENGDTLAIAIDKLGRKPVSKPMQASTSSSGSASGSSSHHSASNNPVSGVPSAVSGNKTVEMQKSEEGRLPSMDFEPVKSKDMDPNLAILEKVMNSKKDSRPSIVTVKSGKSFVLMLVGISILFIVIAVIFREPIKNLINKPSSKSSSTKKSVKDSPKSNYQILMTRDDVDKAIKANGFKEVLRETDELFGQRKTNPKIVPQLMARYNAIHRYTQKKADMVTIERSTLEKIVILSCETSAEKVFSDYTRIFLARFKDLKAIRCDNSSVVFVRQQIEK
ncbi:protein kinase [Myxococcota bacterium]|nr:protein kinase [Myxococcota bacterium]MBU1380835.1 protein kinase [Myxococcota bacterium]MBU1499187.1 protein kinase [Myxococcota bacterium]